MRQRRGSALLVVLGMVSFLVISAVAFSAYMRNSRLPSSFMRQTVASRLLAKAALANAIDEIDAAIGNNPHPNVGDTQYMYPRDDGKQMNRNSWRGRVYMGTNLTSSVDVAAEAEDTVTPLGFEALAYIPPPLVNEVRYYSRRSMAAQWRGLGFNAGRYVFCAVDVSDYFDINAIKADVQRSSDPESKVSLAYLFEYDEHKQSNAGPLGGADAWDSFMNNFRGNDKVPLVSLADWHLAMKSSGPFQPPFGNYVGKSTEDGSFYGNDDELDKSRRMTFVTDGYFPVGKSSTGGEVYDLADENNQPWKEDVLSTWKANACELAAYAEGKGFERLEKLLPFPARAALFDYLDNDRVPCSLALPTVERAPMICGIEVTMANDSCLAAKDMIEEKNKYKYDPDERPNQDTRTTTKTLRYNLDAEKLKLGDIQVSALATCPFRHQDGVDAKEYDVDGVLLLFLTSDEMGLRPGKVADRLKEVMLDINNQEIYKKSAIKDGVISLKLTGTMPKWQGDLKSQREAVQPVVLTVDGEVAADLEKADNALFSAELKCTQKAQLIDPQDPDKGYNWDNPVPANADIENDAGTTAEKAECKLLPFKADGEIDGAYQQNAADLFSLFKKGGTDLRLNVAVVLRVKEKGENGKFVDMVPATGSCDAFNRTNNDSGEARGYIAEVSGDWSEGAPLMRLDTGASFTWGREGFEKSSKSSAKIAIAPKTVFIGDPRYNYAPESWFRYDGDCSEDNWLKECGAKDADGDIFMQTSDQCWLQSVYEFANLPRVGSFNEDGEMIRGDPDERGRLLEPGSFGLKTYAEKGKELNRDFMWKTYDPFDRYRDDGDGIEKINLISDGNGFKVNPYSDSTNILMAAFANTPHDWRCAYYDNPDIKNKTADGFNTAYAWNEYSSGARLNWDNLEEVAGEFMNEVRTNPAGTEYEESWEVAFRKLGWQTAKSGGTDNENYLLDGLDLDGGCKVFNTDRKFLYGFWHDCFSARQQLFLIFVRAEPVMMGGGAVNQTPPQLGARAVALVWRDPSPTEMDGNVVLPHRTRILFYRQFD